MCKKLLVVELAHINARIHAAGVAHCCGPLKREMDRFPNRHPQFVFPEMYTPGHDRFTPWHAYDVSTSTAELVCLDPMRADLPIWWLQDHLPDHYFARDARPGQSLPRDERAYAYTYGNPRSHTGQPRQHSDTFEDDLFPQATHDSWRGSPYRHLTDQDPGYIDLRFLPGFARSSDLSLYRQQRAGILRPVSSHLPACWTRDGGSSCRKYLNLFLF